MPEQSELVQALTPVIRYFEDNHVSYFVGGSVASSHHGASRSTLDVDLTVVFGEENISSLINRLSGDYYLSEPAMREAVGRKSCFNLIHLKTSFKVDIFVSRGREFDKVSLDRAIQAKLGEAEQLVVRVASVEDIVLIKLQWYRLGNEISERQWSDLITVVRLNRPELDIDYLHQWAEQLGVDDLLLRLLNNSL